MRQFLVVLAILVEQSDGLTIASLGIGKLFALPIDITQRQQQHTFLDTASRGFLVTRLVGVDSCQRVTLCHIDVADGIVNLVEIFSIVVVAGHTFQLAYHLLAVVLGHHLSLGDAGVELQLVRRTQSHHVLIGAVGLLLVSKLILDLSQQKPLAGTLNLSALVLDGFLEIGDGLHVVGLAEVVVGVGVVPILNGTEVHRVATHISNHVLGIISPTQFGVTFCEPSARQSAHQRFALIQSRHIREGSGSLFKLPHLELSLTHQQPRSPKERVLLFAFLLDAMALDSFLHLLNGALVVRLAYVATRLIANGIERYQLCVVILVVFLLFQIAVDKGQLTVIISIIAGVERVPEARTCRILLRRTTNYRHCDSHNHQYVLRLESHNFMSSSGSHSSS